MVGTKRVFLLYEQLINQVFINFSFVPEEQEKNLYQTLRSPGQLYMASIQSFLLCFNSFKYIPKHSIVGTQMPTNVACR